MSAVNRSAHVVAPTMNKVLRSKPHLHVGSGGDDTVFLIGEHERFLPMGRLQALVTPPIDGRRTTMQLVESLASDASPPEVLYVITVLERGDTWWTRRWIVTGDRSARSRLLLVAGQVHRDQPRPSNTDAVLDRRALCSPAGRAGMVMSAGQ